MLLSLIPVIGLCFCREIRTEIRKKRRIPGAGLTDLLTHVCCSPCALIQESQEVDLMEQEAMMAASAQKHVTSAVSPRVSEPQPQAMHQRQPVYITSETESSSENNMKSEIKSDVKQALKEHVTTEFRPPLPVIIGGKVLKQQIIKKKNKRHNAMQREIYSDGEQGFVYSSHQYDKPYASDGEALRSKHKKKKKRRRGPYKQHVETRPGADAKYHKKKKGILKKDGEIIKSSRKVYHFSSSDYTSCDNDSDIYVVKNVPRKKRKKKKRRRPYESRVYTSSDEDSFESSASDRPQYALVPVKKLQKMGITTENSETIDYHEIRGHKRSKSTDSTKLLHTKDVSTNGNHTKHHQRSSSLGSSKRIEGEYGEADVYSSKGAECNVVTTKMLTLPSNAVMTEVESSTVYAVLVSDGTVPVQSGAKQIQLIQVHQSPDQALPMSPPAECTSKSGITRDVPAPTTANLVSHGENLTESPIKDKHNGTPSVKDNNTGDITPQPNSTIVTTQPNGHQIT